MEIANSAQQLMGSGLHHRVRPQFMCERGFDGNLFFSGHSGINERRFPKAHTQCKFFAVAFAELKGNFKTGIAERFQR